MTRVGTVCHADCSRLVISICGLLVALNFSSPAAARPSAMDSGPGFEEARRDAPPARKRPKAHRGTTETSQRQLPVGPVHIIVSIAKQRAALFINDTRIAEAPISTGVAGHPTPMGVFMVIAKSRYHSSNIYSGAPMPYMQRITWSGIALHQGPLPGYPASHGCIRLPEAFAVRLWAISKVGARVIVTRDETAPFRFESARLFVPKKPAAILTDVTDTPAATVMASAAPIAAPVAAAPATGPSDPSLPAAAAPKRNGPVQVFVSRKDARLYVRRDFAPLFDAPITIAAPDKAWGTHVFTVTDIKDDKAEWTAVTIPSGFARAERHSRKLSAKELERQQARTAELAEAPTAAQALERFELPQEAVERISELLAPGSALTVSDNALSDETGEETDFIVLTP